MNNLAVRSAYELLPLGTNVAFHHRAGIARWMPLDRNQDRDGPYGWKIVEGTYRGEMVPGEPLSHFEQLREMFFQWPQAAGRNPTEKRNKTVMVWPHLGFGFIIGIIRRSCGYSRKSHSYNSMDGWDFDPGYHVTDIYVDLYVVKQIYEGTDYILCPLWAVSEVDDE